VTFGNRRCLLSVFVSCIGFTTPSGVQAACIPAILSGENVMANSPTGTGKTLTFAIPIVQHCNEDPHPGFCLILTPTRELASQIADQFRSIGGSAPSVACIIGGIDFQEQSKEIQTRPLHVIATPGR
jgi:ATP-dependent RNA helicase DDX49/DBP8